VTPTPTAAMPRRPMNPTMRNLVRHIGPVS